MCVEIIERHTHEFGVRVTLVHQPFHLVCEIDHRPSVGHGDVPPARLRFDEEKEMTVPLPSYL